jgi:cytochrome c oxidase subunit IV
MLLYFLAFNIVMHSMTLDWFWIDNSIYWTLIQLVLVHFTDPCHTQTSVLSNIAWWRLSVMDVCLLPGLCP